MILNNFLGTIWNAIKLFLIQFFSRIWRLIRHVLIVPFLARKRNQFNWTSKSTFYKLYYSFVWWLVIVILKTIDLFGVWEIIDIFQFAIKPRSRKLNEIELQEAIKVFGASLPFAAIRIDENSLLAKLGAKFNRSSQLGLVTFRHVNFTRKLDCQPGNSDMDWLIHELTHVAQMQKLGGQYIIEALYAQHSSGYGYGGESSLENEQLLSSFNLEQQAEITRHFYRKVLFGESDAKLYQPYILQMRAGQF